VRNRTWDCKSTCSHTEPGITSWKFVLVHKHIIRENIFALRIWND